MGKEWVTFKGLNDRYDSVMATNSQIISLGYIVSQNNSGGLADSRENGQQYSAF
jgi:hypothetical protein